MSQKKNSLYSPTPIVKNGDLSASLTSPVTAVQFLDNIMLQIVATGSPTGTFAVQTSLDFDPNTPTVTPTWTSLQLSGTPALTGSGDTILITLNQLPGPYIRTVYTRSAGTGSCNINISAKEI